MGEKSWPRTRRAENTLDGETLITLTSDIVAAHVSKNSVGVDEVPTLIQNVYGALVGLGAAPQEKEGLCQPKCTDW